MSVTESVLFDMASVRTGLKGLERELDSSAKRQGDILEKHLGTAGVEGAKSYRKALQAELARQTVLIKVARAGGMDPTGLNKLKRAADEAFNQGVLRGLDRMRKAGHENTEEYNALARSLKNVGRAAHEINRPAQAGGGFLQSLGSVKGWIAGIGAAIAGSRLIQWAGDATQSAIELAQSYMRLTGTSRLYGIEQKELNQLARSGQTEFKLSAGIANDLAAKVAKFAAIAGDASKAELLRARALDLGAAQGLTAAQVGDALEQTLRGQDEGLDKLIQKNPSQVYKEWAAANHAAVAAMTSQQQKQAIVTALVEAGSKVQGEYGRQLQNDVGRMNLWNQSLTSAKQTIGSALLPVVVTFTDHLRGPMLDAVRLITSALDALQSPLERSVRHMKELGDAPELIAPLEIEARRSRNESTLNRLRDEVAADRRGAVASGRGFTTIGTDINGDINALIRANELLRNQATDPAIRNNLVERGRALQAIADKELEIRDLEVTIAADDKALPIARERKKLAIDLLEVENKMADLGDEKSDSDFSKLARANLLKHQAELKKALGLDAKPTTVPPSPIDDAALKAGKKAVVDLIDQFRDLARAQAAGFGFVHEQASKVAELDRQILQTEERIADARKGGQAVSAVVLEGLQKQKEERDRELATLNQIGAKYKEFISTFRQATAAGPVKDSVLGFFTPAKVDPIVKALETYEAALRGIREERARDLVTAEDAAKQEKEAADAFNKAIIAQLDLLRKKGKLTAKEQEQLERLIALLKLESKETTKGNVGLSRKASAFVGVARGIMSAADAMGELGEREKQVLQGLIDIGEGIARIASGDIIGGVAQGVGGVIAMLSHSGEEERRAQFDQIESMSRLKDALDRLRTAVLTTTTQQQKSSTVGVIQSWLDERARGASQGIDPSRGTWKVGAITPEVLSALRILAEKTGIPFLNGNEINFDELRKALDSFKDLPLGSFGTSVADQLDALSFVLAALGEDGADATERLQRFLDVVKKFEPGFASKLQEVLAASGPDGAKKWIQSLIELFASGGVAGVADVFGDNITAEDIKRILEEALGFVAAGATPGTSRSTQIGHSITEVQADEVIAWLQDIAHWSRLLYERSLTGFAVSAALARNDAVAAFLSAASSKSFGGASDSSIAQNSRAHYHFFENSKIGNLLSDDAQWEAFIIALNKMRDRRKGRGF